MEIDRLFAGPSARQLVAPDFVIIYYLDPVGLIKMILERMSDVNDYSCLIAFREPIAMHAGPRCGGEIHGNGVIRERYGIVNRRSRVRYHCIRFAITCIRSFRRGLSLMFIGRSQRG